MRKPNIIVARDYHNVITKCFLFEKVTKRKEKLRDRIYDRNQIWAIKLNFKVNQSRKMDI